MLSDGDVGRVLREEGIRMKKKTPEQELKELCKEIRSEIDHWDVHLLITLYVLV